MFELGLSYDRMDLCVLLVLGGVARGPLNVVFAEWTLSSSSEPARDALIVVRLSFHFS